MYKLILLPNGQYCGVIRLTDNAFIPFDPANTDAQAFAKWLQEGNLPEPAEEDGTVTQEWATEKIGRAHV